MAHRVPPVHTRARGAPDIVRSEISDDPVAVFGSTRATPPDYLFLLEELENGLYPVTSDGAAANRIYALA